MLDDFPPISESPGIPASSPFGIKAGRACASVLDQLCPGALLRVGLSRHPSRDSQSQVTDPAGFGPEALPGMPAIIRGRRHGQSHSSPLIREGGCRGRVGDCGTAYHGQAPRPSCHPPRPAARTRKAVPAAKAAAAGVLVAPTTRLGRARCL